MASSTEKLDLMKLHKDEYALSKEPVFVDVKPAQFLTISGTGKPGGEEFQARLHALYNVAYAIKMARKSAGSHDYKVSTLEGQWWNAPGGTWSPDVPQEEWQWRLMIRTPDFVTKNEMQNAIAKLEEKKNPLIAKVRLESVTEGRCVQMLHTGPYTEEAATLRVIFEFIEANKVRPNGKHHEIYFSDPRRVKPEKLRTILRIPVR
jgi:hypothetical protein